MTLRDTVAKALEAQGEKRVEYRSDRYWVYTRLVGGFYFLGKNGAVRVGKTATDSIPLSENGRQVLLGNPGALQRRMQSGGA